MNINSIDYLILTHTHFDHAENASRIKREYGAKVIVNMREVELLQNGETFLPHGTVFITRMLTDKIVPHFLKRLTFESCQPDILVEDSFDLKAFGFNAYILHTPGHSPGSQSIIIDEEIALTGDAMFGIFPGSIFPPFASDADEMVRSWGKLLNTKCSLFLPSHGTANSRELVLKEFQRRRQSPFPPKGGCA